jgi:hypothetical protein
MHKLYNFIRHPYFLTFSPCARFVCAINLARQRCGGKIVRHTFGTKSHTRLNQKIAASQTYGNTRLQTKRLPKIERERCDAVWQHTATNQTGPYIQYKTISATPSVPK